MKIVFATNNKNKLAEIRDMLGDKIEVMSLADINCHEDIPETADTLEGNALQKARYVFDKYGMSCFADDTGLEVDALGGEPGVYSARYAGGEGHDSEANMAKLMQKLGDNDNRKARFRTVIALITGSGDDGVKLFEGVAEGDIIREKRGGEGFGYDPIFRPEGYDKTFAELGHEIKNKISHRARAVQKLVEYLKQQAATDSRLPLYYHHRRLQALRKALWRRNGNAAERRILAFYKTNLTCRRYIIEQQATSCKQNNYAKNKHPYPQTYHVMLSACAFSAIISAGQCNSGGSTDGWTLYPATAT